MVRHCLLRVVTTVCGNIVVLDHALTQAKAAVVSFLNIIVMQAKIMSKTYNPYYAEIAKPIAVKVTYPFSVVYDMVLMGLDGEEIEKICNLGAALELPVYDPMSNSLVRDLQQLSRGYFALKSEIVHENMQKVFDSMVRFEQKPHKRILSDRAKHNWQQRERRQDWGYK